MALGSCREGAGTKSLRHFRHFSACLKLVRNKKVKIEKDVVGRVEMKGQNVDRDMSLWHFIYFKASVMKLRNTSPLPAVPCDWPPSPLPGHSARHSHSIDPSESGTGFPTTVLSLLTMTSSSGNTRVLSRCPAPCAPAPF